MKTLLPEHLKAYLDAANIRGVLPMFYLELVSGLRKGELVALLWSVLFILRKQQSNPSAQLYDNRGHFLSGMPGMSSSLQIMFPVGHINVFKQDQMSFRRIFINRSCDVLPQILLHLI